MGDKEEGMGKERSVSSRDTGSPGIAGRKYIKRGTRENPVPRKKKWLDFRGMFITMGRRV